MNESFSSVGGPRKQKHKRELVAVMRAPRATGDRLALAAPRRSIPFVPLLTLEVQGVAMLLQRLYTPAIRSLGIVFGAAAREWPLNWWRRLSRSEQCN